MNKIQPNLQFGTGGIRGIMGPADHQMNTKTVERIADGFANYIESLSVDKSRGIVIAYDSRCRSFEFAQTVAEILIHHDIQVYIFETLETTPILSFSIRYLNCLGGICVTASHNPPQYNGIKIYWEDGGQIVPPQDEHIIHFINNNAVFNKAERVIFEDGLKTKKIKYIPSTVHEAYFADVLSIINWEPKRHSQLSIVYTPLHGTGLKPVTKLCELLNFKNFFVVPEQAQPNGLFPTVQKPNPEEPSALQLAVHYATERNADIIFATDPDSDRLAICVKDIARAQGAYKNQSIGNYVLLNGNQTSALMLNYILAHKANKSNSNYKVVKTIVTSALLESICQKYDIQIYNTPTGFKWIADLIKKWTIQNPEYTFLFGAEESYGYMLGNNVRDKDAIAALACALQIAVEYKEKDQTLCDALFELFSKFGAWQEDLLSFDFEPDVGQKHITCIMDYFRTGSFVDFARIPVRGKMDYLHQENYSENVICPKMDFLQFFLEDGSQISIRPSGTEPKLKIYLSACTSYPNVEEALQQTHDKLAALRYGLTTQVQNVISI